jgi:hypothetical protein
VESVLSIAYYAFRFVIRIRNHLFVDNSIDW